MSNPYDNANTPVKSVLGPTLKFKGELTAEEDLLIQGQVEGSIKHTSTLRIGEEGTVKANVTAEYISVKGTVKGDLTGTSSVKVHEGAEIEGNIYSPSVSLLEGSTFNGSVDMSGKGKPQSMPKQDSQSDYSAESSAAAKPPQDRQASKKKQGREANAVQPEAAEDSSPKKDHKHSKSANAA